MKRIIVALLAAALLCTLLASCTDNRTNGDADPETSEQPIEASDTADDGESKGQPSNKDDKDNGNKDNGDKDNGGELVDEDGWTNEY